VFLDSACYGTDERLREEEVKRLRGWAGMTNYSWASLVTYKPQRTD